MSAEEDPRYVQSTRSPAVASRRSARSEVVAVKRSGEKGFLYLPGVRGKFQFRIREQHVAETYAPLLASKQVGAVKLDLVLRGLALLPTHAGKRETGVVPPRVSYEQLHDLCRVAGRYLLTAPEDEVHEPKVLAAKRNWVGRQLAILEEHGSVERREVHRGRPELVLQRDHGPGAFDDPDGTAGNSYVTVSGPVLARWLPAWGAPEVAAYLASMVADRYARLKKLNDGTPLGGATWFESLDWFSDPNGYRPAGHVRIGFSTRTLERGFAGLRSDGLVTWEHSSRRPDQPGRRFRSGRRNIYTNHFDLIDASATLTEAAATETVLVEKS